MVKLISDTVDTANDNHQQLELAQSVQQNIDSIVSPGFGNVHVESSSEVQIGHNVIYNGPVVINKVLTINDIDGSKPCLTPPAPNGITNGIINNNEFYRQKDCDNEGFVISDEREIKTAKLDDGLFIISNKGIELNNEIFNTKTRSKFEKSRVLYMSACWAAVITTIVLATFVVVKSIGSTARSWQEDTNESESNSPIDDDNATFTGTSKLRIIQRPEWLAQPPIKPATNLTLPVPYVIIHHTATIGCPDRAKCIYQCRQIQTYHIESNGWWDIGYNYLVGGDGFAYKARGFFKEGAHTYGYNSRSICIAFIGTFDQDLPAKRQIRAAKQLISLAVEQGVLTPDFKILAARQLQGTVSPGKALYEDIMTWDHWALKP